MIDDVDDLRQPAPLAAVADQLQVPERHHHWGRHVAERVELCEHLEHLDGALVSLLSFVALLHNNIGCFESSFDVAMAKFTHLRHVRWRFWFR